MNQPLPDLPGDTWVPLAYLAKLLSLSVRNLRRKIPNWPGFPKKQDFGHRTKRYSLNEFYKWREDFKSGGNQPTQTISP